MNEAAIASTAGKTVGLGGLAAAFRLDQELHIGADELRVLLGLDGVLQRYEALEALLHDLLRDLVLHDRSRGSRTRRILEGEGGGKAGATHHIQGGLKVLLRLTGEAHDDIGGNGGVRHFLAHFVEDAQELLRAVGTAHVFEDLVGARLQRHVQLWAHSRSLRHGIDDIGGELCRVRGSKAQAFKPLNLAHFPQQLGKGEAVSRQVRVSEIDAIGIDVLAQQRHLGHSLLHQGLNLCEDVARAAVLFLAAQGRNDAESTGVIAAHGDRYPPGIGGLALGRQHGGKSLKRVDDFNLGLIIVAGAFEKCRQSRHVVGAEYRIDPRRVVKDCVLILLRQAATHSDLHAGVVFLRFLQCT